MDTAPEHNAFPAKVEAELVRIGALIKPLDEARHNFLAGYLASLTLADDQKVTVYYDVTPPFYTIETVADGPQETPDGQ